MPSIHRCSVSSLLLATLLLAFTGCADSEDSAGGGSQNEGISADAPSVAYITNGIASFWVIAEKGAMDGGKKFDANVNVLMPANGVEDQKRMCQDLLAQGIDGIAIRSYRVGLAASQFSVAPCATCFAN